MSGLLPPTSPTVESTGCKVRSQENKASVYKERQPVAINDNASQQIREMAGSFGVLIFSSSGHTEQEACGIFTPRPERNLCPLHWKT
ncbi:hypothetical protein R6Z07F_018136 [Ovis aries]